MVDSPKPRCRPKVGSVAASVLLVLGVLSLALTPVRTDHDMWWHLKTGQLLSEGRLGLSDTDPFTWGSEDVEWHNHEWLAQWGMYQVFRLGTAIAPRVSLPRHSEDVAGVWLLVLAKGLVLVAAFGLVAWTLAKHRICPIVACTVALLGAMASRYSIHCRPPVLTDLFLAGLMLALLGRWHRHHPWKAALAALPLFALWSNLHGGWLAGLVTIGAFGAGDFVAMLWHRMLGQERRRRVALHAWSARCLLFAAAAIGTLINPSGPLLYLLTWRVMSASDLVASIPEMQPPSWPMYWPFFVLLSLAGAGTLWILGRQGMRALGLLFAVLFFACQAYSHLRHIPLFAIVAALPAGRLLQEIWEHYTRGAPSRVTAAAMLGMLLLLTALIPFGLGTGVLHTQRDLIWEPSAPRNGRWLQGWGYEYALYFDDPADVLLVIDPPGRLWTNLNIGGHLIWRLSPEHHRLYTDSRFDIHGDSRQRVEASLNGVGPDGGVPDANWHGALVEMGVHSALLQKATPLVQAMLAHADWALVHEWTSPLARRWEDGTMLFVRRTAEGEAAIGRAERLNP